MKKLLLLLVALVPGFAFAAGGNNEHVVHADIDLTDKASLQRGAQLFMNYCLGCHQMQYQRYERTFNDLDIPVEIGKDNLIFSGEKVGNHITNGMDSKQASKWFGAPPPDLTLEARLRGPDWVYSYLISFYKDPSRPFGVNNLVFPNVGMPHVLEELQGLPTKKFETALVDGENKERFIGLESDGTGRMSPDEYNQAALDLTNFLTYVGEPMRLEREALGYKVIVFLLVFLVFSYLLKKEYWRDVH
ncbi:cytochrome c1 [Algicola sagamiensis]|uniref:cytochrome c1 n=1 Tax=Algicola sagamiensis TaxID=163869 RepID=UPI0003689DED|nr:cytochrome c1 [Algicola sagamiensis]